MRPRRILPALICAQFFGTALWFAGNAVLEDLRVSAGLPSSALGPMTSSVQLGFIVGTLMSAILGVADRFSARGIFLVAALLGAGFNALITVPSAGYSLILALRFLTGITLAGIYPVGMKIAASWYKDGLGAALGWLVGALVLGTAFPHALKAVGAELPWQSVLYGLSAIAALGGILLYALVPNGPHLAKATSFHPRLLRVLFREERFRAAALGYFGHMWELYAFWTVVPVLAGMATRGTSAWSFAIIASGFLACGLGGNASKRHGSALVARGMLAVSGLCCLAAPWALGTAPSLALGFLLLWGFAVVGDSPQFSTLVAKHAPRENVGTALTLVNCIGFALTIPSIELLTRLAASTDSTWPLLLLAPGPLFGIWASRSLAATASPEQ